MQFVYRFLVRPILFLFDPETAHSLATFYLGMIRRIPGLLFIAGKILGAGRNKKGLVVAGIKFPGPVGLAAGFDKDGTLYPSLSRMGFDFIESGTFTAYSQPGNPKPRIFRYPVHGALVNRMGFNNPGSKAVLSEIKNHKRIIPRGINIGKSKITPLEEAVNDYLESLKLLGEHGDYVAINVSSPNTPGLRMLQKKENIQSLLVDLRRACDEIPGVPVFADPDSLWVKKGCGRPLFVKIAPDLDDGELQAIVEATLAAGLDGIIISNTTLDRTLVPESENEAGGLSGLPVKKKSTEMIARVRELTDGKLAIIGVGGIFNGNDAAEKLKAGASLVQVYTGYIYQGPYLPAMIRRNSNVRELLKKDYQ